MLTINYFDKLDGENGHGEVISYGRRWGVVVDEGRITVKRNEDTSYDRTPRWKINADIKKITEFAAEYMRG